MRTGFKQKTSNEVGRVIQGRGLHMWLAAYCLIAGAAIYACSSIRCNGSADWFDHGCQVPPSASDAAALERIRRMEAAVAQQTARYVHAVELRRAGHFPEAVQAFKKIIRDSNTRYDQADARVGLAQTYVAMNRPQQALEECDSVIDDFAAKPDFDVFLGARAAQTRARIIARAHHTAPTTVLAEVATASNGNRKSLYTLALGWQMILDGNRRKGLDVLRTLAKSRPESDWSRQAKGLADVVEAPQNMR